MKDYEMTTEQTNQWAREAAMASHDTNSSWLQRFATLARADLVEQLDIQAGSIEAVQAANVRLAVERDALKAEVKRLEGEAEAGIFVHHTDMNALRAEVESLRADAAQLRTELNDKRENIALTLQEVDALRADAARYRYLFSDVNLQTIKDAVEQGIPLPSTNAELIEQIIGFYNTKEQADQLVDAAMKRGEA